MMQVPVTLAAAAAAVFVNIWLGWRIAQFREDFKVSVGDGGQEPLLRRMRAQANYIENAPFFLILVAALELSGANRPALAVVTAIFMLARIAHGIGMDSTDKGKWRMWGMIGTSLPLLGLALWALVCAVELCLNR